MHKPRTVTTSTLVVIMIGLLAYPVMADTWGKVVVDHYRCTEGIGDRIVIATNLGFTLAEVYSGYTATHEDKLLFGELHSYGFTDFLDDNGNEAGRIYVDDYMASETTARQWCWG